MNKPLFVLIGICLLLSFKQSHAQGITTVNPLTGTANVTIPLYKFTSGQVSLPISISYSATGIKPKDVEGTAGMGWQLNAGGQISRQVNGLPDDCTKDNGGNTMLGWMSSSNTGATFASTYTILNNGVCANGVADVNYLNSNVPINNDTEPDRFYVNAPGLYCELIYDRADNHFHPVSYQDLVISYTTKGGTGNNASDIASFTITNDKGITYVFAAPDSVTKIASATVPPDYLRTQYKQYQHGITYSDSWSLTSIMDANGNGISLNYSTGFTRNSKDPVEYYLNGSTTETVQYFILQAVEPRILTTIKTTNPNYTDYNLMQFNWSSSTLGTDETYILKINGMGRNFQFTYNNVFYDAHSYSRAFLAGLSDASCSSPVNYQFGYSNTNNSTTLLADSTTNSLDYWEYYAASSGTASLMPSVYVNPSTAGYPRYAINVTATPGSAYLYTLSSPGSRQVNATSISYGSLQTITYANGGTTTLTYEPNDYYDVPSSTTVQGGGIRIKQIVDNPGNGNSITRNYTYTNPCNRQSSGEPVTLPQYAFTIPYSGIATGHTLWLAATALSAYDLSTEDHTIMYSSVKQSQTGAGSTVYNYNVPATYWNTSATPICNGCTTQEWAPTVNYTASYSCGGSSGPIANIPYAYPFAPNPNYDFERGFPASIINYNDAGKEVSETDYTYQRSFTPSSITAFKSEDSPTNPIAKYYSKYTVFYNTSELNYTVTNKTFDSPTLSQARTTTTNYTYGSAYHKLLTQAQITNSDNSVVTSKISYVKDFPLASAGANANVNALYYLRQMNINSPVETSRQVTQSGTPLTTSANLTLYSASANGAMTNYMPSQQLKWIQPDGAAFTPLAVTATSLTHDGGYFPALNFDKYDNAGSLLTADDANGNYVTTLPDHLSQKATAIFKNIRYNELAFNDFDSQFAPQVNTFTITGTGTYTPVGSHAGIAAGLVANTQTVTSGLITKDTLAQNYIFSIWINAATAGKLTLSGVGTVSPVNYTNTGWVYYQLKIPAANLSATFTLSFTSNQNISIDDILLYPDVAEVATATFDQTSHYKIAQTNTNGISAYYTNDLWGRVLYAYDQDKNIVQRNTIMTTQSQNSYSSATIVDPGIVIINQPVSFHIIGPDNCSAAGIMVTWNFGDGTIVTTAGLTSPNHTFTSAGTVNVNATLNSPMLGSKVAPTINITVHPASFVVPLIYIVHPTDGGTITSVTFTPIGTGTAFSYSGTSINGGFVYQGEYTVKVQITGPPFPGSGYASMALSSNSFNICNNRQSSGTYTFTADLSTCTGLTFSFSKLQCD